MRAAIHFTALAIFVVMLSGCHTIAARGHAVVAETLEDVAVKTRKIVLELQEQKAREAGEAALKEGRDVEQAIKDATMAFESGPLVKSVNAFISAKDAYVASAQTLAESSVGDGAIKELIPHAKAVLESYEDLRVALQSEGKQLPALPDPVVRLLKVL